MRWLALAAIRFYQRVISPRKGFCCAYRSGTGRASCSSLGYRAIRRDGVWDGIGILRLRLAACSDVYHGRVVPPRASLRAQAGSCDCDLPCDFDASSACDCLSEWGDCSWSKPKKEGENARRRRERKAAKASAAE